MRLRAALELGHMHPMLRVIACLLGMLDITEQIVAGTVGSMVTVIDRSIGMDDRQVQIAVIQTKQNHMLPPKKLWHPRGQGHDEPAGDDHQEQERSQGSI